MASIKVEIVRSEKREIDELDTKPFTMYVLNVSPTRSSKVPFYFLGIRTNESSRCIISQSLVGWMLAWVESQVPLPWHGAPPVRTRPTWQPINGGCARRGAGSEQ